jgi:hypothetical protein
MLYASIAVDTQAMPFVEPLLALLRQMVWPCFWLIVCFGWKKDIRRVVSALINLLDRAISVKFWSVQLEIQPPEAVEALQDPGAEIEYVVGERIRSTK